jgi:hypothetical protein
VSNSFPAAAVSSRWLPDSEILILASPAEFVFRDSFEEFRLPTVLWLSGDGKLDTVDDRIPISSAIRRVEVFSPAPTDPVASRCDMLFMLLQHGIKRLTNEAVFRVRPQVRFASLESFAALLTGFQRDLFEQAARRAGARVVRFDD